MDKDIDDLIKVLKLKGYSNKTAKVYISNIKKYLLSNYDQTTDGFNNYIISLINSNKYQENTINQNINSINFFFKHVIKNSVITASISAYRFRFAPASSKLPLSCFLQSKNLCK